MPDAFVKSFKRTSSFSKLVACLTVCLTTAAAPIPKNAFLKVLTAPVNACVLF